MYTCWQYLIHIIVIKIIIYNRIIFYYKTHYFYIIKIIIILNFTIIIIYIPPCPSPNLFYHPYVYDCRQRQSYGSGQSGLVNRWRFDFFFVGGGLNSLKKVTYTEVCVFIICPTITQKKI